MKIPQLLNLHKNPVPTYIVETGHSYDEINDLLIKERRKEINELIKSKKDLCCKKTIVECLTPIIIDQIVITNRLYKLSEHTMDEMFTVLCKILDADELNEPAFHLVSDELADAIIVCKNDYVSAVAAEMNNGNCVVAFIPSSTYSTNSWDAAETLEYLSKARELCNKAARDLHAYYGTKLTKRRDECTITKLQKAPFKDISIYGY